MPNAIRSLQTLLKVRSLAKIFIAQRALIALRPRLQLREGTDEVYKRFSVWLPRNSHPSRMPLAAVCERRALSGGWVGICGPPPLTPTKIDEIFLSPRDQRKMMGN